LADGCPLQQLHGDNRWAWRRPRPSGYITAVVFQIHAGDNCWHCFRLHYPRLPAQYIIIVKPSRSEATWRLVALCSWRPAGRNNFDASVILHLQLFVLLSPIVVDRNERTKPTELLSMLATERQKNTADILHSASRNKRSRWDCEVVKEYDAFAHGHTDVFICERCECVTTSAAHARKLNGKVHCAHVAYIGYT